MEEIRSANNTLREWGNSLVTELEDQDEKIKELNDEIEALKKTVEDRDDDLASQAQRIKELEQEIADGNP